MVAILKEAGCEMIFGKGGMDLSLHVDEMIAMSNDGKTQKEIADYFGTKQPVISKLLKCTDKTIPEDQEKENRMNGADTELQKKIERLDSEKCKLEAMIKDKDEHIGRLKQENESLVSENCLLKTQNEELVEIHGKADRDYQSLCIKCNQLSTTVDVLVDKIAILRRVV